MIKVRKTRRKTVVTSETYNAGEELVTGVKRIFKDDKVTTNVRLSVKTCDGKAFKAEVDLTVRERVFELKNWTQISPGEAKTVAAQIERQQTVLGHIHGNPVKHAGLIVDTRTKLSPNATKVFSEKGIPVYRVVEGKLKVVVNKSGKIID